MKRTETMSAAGDNTKVSDDQNASNVEAEKSPKHPPTSYIDTLIHIFKGNVGPGAFAMGDAFKNGGMLLSPILTVAIAILSIHCQYILLNSSERVRVSKNEEACTDYAQTVEHCFQVSKYRAWSTRMRVAVNIFICITQMGFCCVYFVFIGTNVMQILSAYNIDIPIKVVIALAFPAILLISLITNLKWLTPVSLIASICMLTGFTITLYLALKDGLPDITDRKLLTNPRQMGLFFGTLIYSFEGIALVLPLKNAMKKPSNFDRTFGVLNVGMFFVTFIFMFAGGIGYLKWGEKTAGSLTLNLGDTVIAQCVKIVVCVGVLLGYPLQFFIAIQIMWPTVMEKLNVQHKPFTGELIFRTIFVIITLCIAELVPALGLFISLIGAFCSTSLALVFPPIIELLSGDGKGPGCLIISKNLIILLIALLGFVVGTYESLSQIIMHFGEAEVVN